MAKLLEEIQPQAFELVRDRIADVLAEEIAAQLDFTGDFSDDFNAEGIDIYCERSIPFDKTELPAINVQLAKGDYNNEDAKFSDGNYVYNIDVYTSSKSTEDDQGDRLATLKLHKLIGVCRAILKAPVYRTLGFQAPFIMRVTCGEFSIAETTKQDTLHTAMGRLLFNVRVPENVELQVAKVINGYETKWKIAESDKGYITIGGI